MSRADQGAGRGANPRGMARSQTARPDRTSGDPLPAGQVAGFQLRDFVVAQAHVQRLGRVQEMPRLGRPHDWRAHAGPAEQPCQRDLRWRQVALAGDRGDRVGYVEVSGPVGAVAGAGPGRALLTGALAGSGEQASRQGAVGNDSYSLNGRNLRDGFGVSAWLLCLVRAGADGWGGRGDGDGAGLAAW